ncbi:unnamed protein product, partial [Laminaria digitata]
TLDCVAQCSQRSALTELRTELVSHLPCRSTRWPAYSVTDISADLNWGSASSIAATPKIHCCALQSLPRPRVCGRCNTMGRGQRAWLRAAALLASVSGLAYAMEDNAPGTTGLLEAAVGGKRTLVLADWPQIQDSHSMFFSALKARGHELAFRFSGTSGSNLPLTLFGEREFDNLVLLAQPVSGGADKRKGAVTIADVMGFIEDGGNVLVAGGEDMGVL